MKAESAKAEHERTLARERARKSRARKRAGRRCVMVEVDEVDLMEALVAEGALDPMQDDDPREYRQSAWSADRAVGERVTRDATPRPNLLC